MVIKMPTDKDVFEKLDFAFDGLDSERAKGLQKLKTLHSIKNNGATREKNRLIVKYGAEHPKVKKLDERLTFNIGLAKELDVEIEKTKITTPDFDVNSWLVHGRIVNEEGTSQSGLTVSLYDEYGNWIDRLGHACTDERGYFAIKYTVKSEEKPEIPNTQKLILTIADSDGNILHQESDPLYLQVGQIDYRLIVIKDKGDICPPPKPCEGDTSKIPPDAWVVRGVVHYEDKSPGADLTVSLYDKDLFFDDVLGTVLTDEAGRFQMIYRTEAFRDLFEKKPDLYLKVLDHKGNHLYSSKKAIRSEAGRVENFPIELKRKAPRGEK